MRQFENRVPRNPALEEGVGCVASVANFVTVHKQTNKSSISVSLMYSLLLEDFSAELIIMFSLDYSNI